MITRTLNSCGNFEIKQDENTNSVWLYWLGEPLKHLTINEFGDLELLMTTTKI